MLLYYQCRLLFTANYNGSLKAIDCDMQSVGYDIVLEKDAGSRLRLPHQVTYDVVATLIQATNT
eukprot:scaffold2314_cov126-Skeletonema_dohrnii-CCMP3373.AAC.3